MLSDYLRKINPSSEQTYVEDVFSTYLYTGNGSTQNIVNGIDLLGQGGLVWIKDRNNTNGANNHQLNTFASTNFSLTSNTTNGSSVAGVSANSTGFSQLGGYAGLNELNLAYISWTFRKAPKFFDVVTYTGDGITGRQIAHSLGSAPGAIIVKCTNVARDWAVWHRTLADGTYLKLNTTDSVITNTSFQVFGDSSGQTSSVFTVGKTGSGVNGLTNANSAGDTYVAYLFAHDTAADGIIQCGSYTGSSGGVSVNLGFEPQFLIVKNTTTTTNWITMDSMRGMTANNSARNTAALAPSGSFAESAFSGIYLKPTATGFEAPPLSASEVNGNGHTMVYLAIRRGPMKAPTSGTQAFYVDAKTTGGDIRWGNTSMLPDLIIAAERGSSTNWQFADRLRGFFNKFANFNNDTTTTNPFLISSSTASEATSGCMIGIYADGVGGDGSLGIQPRSNSISGYFFRRYPGVFDIVCFQGTLTSGQIVNHNLGVVPELIIKKPRDGGSTYWGVYHKDLGISRVLYMDSTTGSTPSWLTNEPTATDFRIISTSLKFVSYLFATKAGISKVGSYTGNGTNQTIDCGFSVGARFILIKRTDSAGDWYVWDSSRGIVAANDPHLSLNTTAIEVTTDDSVDPASSGFIVNQLAATNINVNAATYIFLAFA